MLASASFGLIPLFTLPMMQEGLQTDSILTYRMFLASALVAVLMLLRGVSFATRWHELPWFAFLGFLYPIGVTLIMRLVFGQRTSPYTILAIVLALSGVALLSLKGDVGMGSSPLAFALVLLSGFSYAIYLVAINNVQLLRAMDNLKLTLYSLLFGGIYFLVDTLLSGGLQPLPSTAALGNLLLLALVPTLLSNLCLVRAIKSIGSTLTSVLGAMEPLTAIVIGVLVLGEQVTPVMLAGVLLIVSAVTIIVLSPLLDSNIAERLRRFARRSPRP